MIYVHVPFCKSFCRYCGFYSELDCHSRSFENYSSLVCLEIDSRREEIEQSRDVNTLYIGGGTPSVLPLSVLSEIVSRIGPADYEEFTVEVNPEDIVSRGPEYVRGLLALGVNRVSMGVQSLSDDVLRWMNRRHDAATARRAYRILRSAGVNNISVDLIYGYSGFPEQTVYDSASELLSWKPDHLSAYQLSVEPGSDLDNSGYQEEDEEICRREYLTLCSMLRAAGYEHYEISNWCLPLRRAVHNSAYWRRVPYVGLGPGAHSLRGNVRSWNSEDLHGWSVGSETLSAEEIREEELMLGLRTDGGYAGRILSEEEWFICDSIALEMLGDNKM